MRRFLQLYAWSIVKNLIGWTLILASWPIGILLPGPGGIPLFIIGFALVSFPGKRQLTARVLRGREMELRGLALRDIAIAVALLLPAVAFAILSRRYGPLAQIAYWPWPYQLALGAGAAVVAWGLARASYRLINWMLRTMPRARRKFRPWMRDHGIRLLPPRHRLRRRHPQSPPDDEILELHARHRYRLRRFLAICAIWRR